MAWPPVTHQDVQDAVSALQTTTATLGRFRPPTFVGLGDSITADGGHVWNGSAAPDLTYGTSWCWHFLGQLQADSRALWLGNFGQAGTTIDQIHDTYLPYLLAKTPAPTYCVLLAGQNSLATLTSTQLALYADMVTQLIGAGITPILCTLTPSTTDRALFVLNSHIRQLAQRYGLPLVDLFAAVVDPTTGLWQAALTRDGVHPTPAGAGAMGSALAGVLTKLIPVNAMAAWLPPAQTPVVTGRGGSTGTDYSNLLLLNSKPGFPNDPAGWDTMSGWYAGIGNLAAAGAPVVGNRWTSTYAAASGQVIIRSSAAVTDAHPGDQMLAVGRIKTDVAAHGGGWALSVVDGAGASLWEMGRNINTRFTNDLTGIFALTWTQGSNATATLDLTVDTGDGSSLGVSEVAFYNLTGLGVA